jgi:hypothetical protein
MSVSPGEGPVVRACRDCGQIKLITEFHVSPRRKYGRGSYCQPCFNERSKKSYAKRVKDKFGREVREPIIVPAGHRHCPDCNEIKQLDEFPRNKNGRGGHGSYCKPCHNLRGQKTRKELYGGSWNYHLKARYGITEAEFDALLLRQGGKCAICGAPEPEHVDHDHLFGNVRGILCFNCNGGLGQFKDDVTTMQRAIIYLKETSCQRVLVHPGVYRLLSPRRVFLPSRSS